MIQRNEYITKTDESTGMVCGYGLRGRGPEMERKGRRAAAVLIAMAVLLAGAFLAGRAMAEKTEQPAEAYVMLKAGDYLHVRTGPGKRYEKLGYLESGDRVITDGWIRGKWVHVIGLSMEETEGWIYGGYIVDEMPEQMDGEIYKVTARGRVACRKWAWGPRQGWVKRGSRVKVYAMGGGWALTNRGYIMSDYLDACEK